MADKKINDTKEMPAGSVLESTLQGMNEWDMNKINDVGGSRPYNGPDKLRGSK